MRYVVTESRSDCERALLLALWQRNLSLAGDNRWLWLYERGTARSWLVRTGEGEVVGSTGLMVREMKLGRRHVRAGLIIDPNVDAEHRAQGAALELQQAVTAALAAERLALVYVLPRPPFDALLRSAGYRPAGAMERWVHPLSFEPPIRRRLALGPLAQPLARVADPVWRLSSAEHSHRLPEGLEIETPDRFDERFDRLWADGSRQFAIVGERTAAYLDWRYRQCPATAARVFCLARSARELVGYAVYHLDADGAAWISDFFFADQERALDDLLAALLADLRARGAGAANVYYFGAARVGRALRRFGFSKRPFGRELHLYSAPETAPADLELLFDRENWFVTKADIDGDP